MDRKGFTLVELLIVIGILGVLATAVVLVLNPAELLRQARDSTRLQDLATVNSALAFYASTASSPVATTTAHNTTTGTVTCDSQASVTGLATSTVADVDTTGWVGVNFGDSTGGSPLAALPLDPENDSSWFYCYKGATNVTWELVTQMESTKFANTGTDDRESTDGGDNNDWVEIGTDPALDLL